MTKRMAGFQKPLSDPKPESVTLAAIQTEGYTVSCSCGWATNHPRKKIREDAAQVHIDKHHGRAVWL